PIVLAALPDGIIRTVDDIGVVEGAERDGDQLGIVAAAIIDGRAALRAEMIGRGLAAVGRPGPCFGLAFDLDAFGRPAGLGRESAAGALLAGEAVADRHPDGIALGDGAELAAAARGAVLGHLAAFRSARRTSASSEAPSPSSSCAALTAALASGGLKPRRASGGSACAAGGTLAIR